MPDLDQHLQAARRDLVARIDVPDLADVRGRARGLRRRRRVVAGAVAALTLLVGTGTVLANDAWIGTGGVDVATTPSESGFAGSVWRGGGLTLLGLNGTVLDLPGELRDVQFANRERGYALAASCAGGDDSCQVSIAVTADGGRTWTSPSWLATPFGPIAGDRIPSLAATDTGVLLAGVESWFAAGPNWGFTKIGTHDEPVDAIPAGGRLQVRGEAGGTCVTHPVEIVLPDGWRARLANQPAMDVCRVAPAPTAGGSWWVGGSAGGLPAVGVSRDAGRSWQVVALPAAPTAAWAQVSTLGRHVFATVVSRRSGDPYPETLTVQAVYRSVDGGPFDSYLGGGPGGGTSGTLIGDVVPLLAGGLVAAGPAWQIGARGGRAFERTDGTMPWVQRLQRTPGAWVAYNLFEAGWAAISYDGATWQKINLR